MKTVIKHFCSKCVDDTRHKVKRNSGEKEAIWDIECKVCGTSFGVDSNTGRHLLEQG